MFYSMDRISTKTASNNQNIEGEKVSQIKTINDKTKVIIEKVEDQNNFPNYIAKWERNRVLYFITGKIEEKEIEKIVKNMVY